MTSSRYAIKYVWQCFWCNWVGEKYPDYATADQALKEHNLVCPSDAPLGTLYSGWVKRVYSKEEGE